MELRARGDGQTPIFPAVHLPDGHLSILRLSFGSHLHLRFLIYAYVITLILAKGRQRRNTVCLGARSRRRYDDRPGSNRRRAVARKDPMRRAAALGCVVTAALLVAACGGGGSSSTMATTSGPGTVPNTPYCTAAQQVQQATTALAANPSQLSAGVAAIDRLAAVAPSEIAPSVQTLRAFYARILAQLGTTPPNAQTVMNAVNSAAKGQENQITGAGNKVTEYTKRTCGINLGGSTSTTTKH